MVRNSLPLGTFTIMKVPKFNAVRGIKVHPVRGRDSEGDGGCEVYGFVFLNMADGQCVCVCVRVWLLKQEVLITVYPTA